MPKHYYYYYYYYYYYRKKRFRWRNVKRLQGHLTNAKNSDKTRISNSLRWIASLSRLDTMKNVSVLLIAL